MKATLTFSCLLPTLSARRGSQKFPYLTKKQPEERGLRAIMALRQTIHLFFFGQFRNSLKFHPSPSLSLPPPPPFPLYEKWKASMANIHALLDASPFPPCLHTITGA
jgi:hypothetical protein